MKRKLCCLPNLDISFRPRDIQVFKISKLTYTKILIKSDEKRYLSQFLSEMFDSAVKSYNKSAPKYELNNSIWFYCLLHKYTDTTAIKADTPSQRLSGRNAALSQQLLHVLCGTGA